MIEVQKGEVEERRKKGREELSDAAAEHGREDERAKLFQAAAKAERQDNHDRLLNQGLVAKAEGEGGPCLRIHCECISETVEAERPIAAGQGLSPQTAAASRQQV